jgi:hypothetical protein
MTEKPRNREVIFEFRPIGNVMKVTAMDTASLTEISVQCPIGAGESAFKKHALQRLEYVLRNKNSE